MWDMKTALLEQMEQQLQVFPLSLTTERISRFFSVPATGCLMGHTRSTIDLFSAASNVQDELRQIQAPAP